MPHLYVVKVFLTVCRAIIVVFVEPMYKRRYKIRTSLNEGIKYVKNA